MRIEVVEILRPELRQPILLCGLPGSGFVGKMAVDHLVKELRAEPFMELYSYGFPAQVVIERTGIARLIRNTLYYAQIDNYPRDFVLYTGDAQPASGEAEYALAERVLDICASLGVKQVYTLAAYMTGSFVTRPKVYGTSTHEEFLTLLRQNGVILMNEGAITGMNGILIGLAKLKGMVGTSLLGETSGYIVDAQASEVVLKALSKILGMVIDLSDLRRRAKEVQAMIRMAQEMRRRAEAEEETEEKGGRRDLGYIS